MIWQFALCGFRLTPKTEVDAAFADWFARFTFRARWKGAARIALINSGNYSKLAYPTIPIKYLQRIANLPARGILLLTIDNRDKSPTSHLGNWQVFATAAGAALAMSSTASAGIIYDLTPNVTASLASTGTASAPFTVAGVKEKLLLRDRTATSGRHSSATIRGRVFNQTLIFEKNNGAVKRLAPYSAVSVQTNGTGGSLRDNSNGRAGGRFGPGTVTGYVGFRAPNGDLGWLLVKVADTDGDGYVNEIQLLADAYNDVAGAPIAAGQTTDAPEPGTAGLALLATGAAGLLAWRKRRTR
jgi:hypothetical protein